MINVKDQIYSAIKGLTENVGDIFPAIDAKLPAILYTEEDNAVQEWVDGEESKSKLRYKIDIWSEESTSILALNVDSKLSELGLKRTMCQDASDSRVRHKIMRYEGVIDVNTQMVYNNY